MKFPTFSYIFSQFSPKYFRTSIIIPKVFLKSFLEFSPITNIFFQNCSQFLLNSPRIFLLLQFEKNLSTTSLSSKFGVTYAPVSNSVAGSMLNYV